MILVFRIGGRHDVIEDAEAGANHLPPGSAGLPAQAHARGKIREPAISEALGGDAGSPGKNKPAGAAGYMVDVFPARKAL